jgi:hypothetical protein
MKAHGTARTWHIDHELSRLQFGYEVILGVSWGSGSTATEASISLETPFSLTRPGASAELVDPEAPETLSPLLALLHQRVAHITADRTGLLEITFSDGTILRVPKRDDGYESWNTSGSGELHDFNMLCSSHEVSPWGE